MKVALFTLLSSAVVAYAAPALHARQACPAPTDPSCKELHDRCVALPATWIQNPWSQRVCVAAATCYGVGNLLTSGACRQSITPPNPRTLPGLSNAVFANFNTCSGCAITQQNYIDFIYGTILTHWPSNVSIVKAWWSAISSWTAFPSQNVPRTNFNDWLLYSTAPTTVTNPPPTTTTTATSSPTGTACTRTYNVVSGDTCSGITGKTGVPVATILALNPTINAGCTNLQIGQVLCLATGTSTATTSPTSTPTSAALLGVQTTCHHDVALTFDDGPYIYNGQVVSDFAGKGKTTFFVNGDNYGCIYDQANVAALRAAYEAGHTIASHTWSHADLSTLTNAQIGVEIDRLDTALWKILGIRPALIRPPYGSYTTSAVNYLNSRGYTVVTWDIDTGDSLGADVATSMNTVRSQATSHSLILAHETLQATASSLAPQIISYIQGTVHAPLISVDKCLDIAPYRAVGSYGVRDSTWVC